MDARLNAFIILMIEDICSRRTAEEREELNKRLFEIGKFIEEESPKDEGHKLAAEVRNLARAVGRYPRIAP